MGDSITDCERGGRNAPYGDGYARMFIDLVTAEFPKTKINYINRGISGNTIIDLKDRWVDDCIAVKPDWLTILIGINDTHQYLGGANPGLTPEVFKSEYDYIVTMAKKRTKAKIILMTPFYITSGQSDNTCRSNVAKKLPEYIKGVEGVARKHGCKLVRLNNVFRELLKYRAPSAFCPEPVHPNSTGHMVIARELLKAFRAH
jgi:lysophospholipase L1-like esterase